MRGEGIAVAVETIKKLRSVKGLRGFDIRCDGDPDAVFCHDAGMDPTHKIYIWRNDS